jgi:hypothetical protein
VKKPAIPEVRQTVPQEFRPVLEALKENVEVITSVRVKKIQPLSTSAALADVIAKVNEILDRLQ